MGEVQVEVVERGCSSFGLERVHLVSSQALDVMEQVGRFVGGGVLVTWFAYEEVGTGVHHLRLYWRENGARMDTGQHG
jgi:hypothetical protein